MVALQDIDRIQQTLCDLSRLTTLLADLDGDQRIDKEKVEAEIKLHSLRSRLFNSLDSNNSDENTSGELSWF